MSTELSRLTTTIEEMRKQLKQKNNTKTETINRQTISNNLRQKHVTENQKQQRDMKYNANAYQCRMIDQFQMDVGYLRDQKRSLLENLGGHNIKDSANFLSRWNQSFFQNLLAETLFIL